MSSKTNFIQQSLELNLFFARIMKEHLIFLASAFTPKNNQLVYQANELKNGLSELLAETVALSNGMISQEVASSEEIVTPFTFNAERATEFYTGIPIRTDITQAEMMLVGYPYVPNVPMLGQRVFMLNQKAICLTTHVVQLKENMLENILACRLFTHNYPLLIDHILREAKLYLKMLYKLQRCDEVDIEKDILEQEIFWNRIMAEHSKFIRGLLDPTEEELIDVANNFAKEFDQLTEDSKKAMDQSKKGIMGVTEESLEATEEIKTFKTQGTEGLLACKIKSVILPLLGDHTLREANHYLRLLKMFRKEMKAY